jgi:ABC-2 type transport system permease protein
MSSLLAAEWLKLRKRWMPRVLLGIMLVIVGLLFWGVGTNAHDRANLFLPRGWLAATLFSTFFAPFLWPILAGSWAGAEYGWGTIRMVLSRRPERVSFALAGLCILLFAVVVAQLILLLFAVPLALLVAALTGHSAVVGSLFTAHFLGIVLKGLLAGWYVLALYVVVAYAAGTLFRSSAVGIGVGIGFTLAELILRGILFSLGGVWETIGRHLPGAYTQALSSRVLSEGLSRAIVDISRDAPTIGESILALGLYMLVPLVLTLFLIRTRDVTA